MLKAFFRVLCDTKKQEILRECVSPRKICEWLSSCYDPTLCFVLPLDGGSISTPPRNQTGHHVQIKNTSQNCCFSKIAEEIQLYKKIPDRNKKIHIFFCFFF